MHFPSTLPGLLEQASRRAAKGFPGTAPDPLADHGGRRFHHADPEDEAIGRTNSIA